MIESSTSETLRLGWAKLTKETIFQTIKTKAKKLKVQVYVLYFAYRDTRVKWHAKLLAICVVAYAFSPIDLIPDFIPILGYVDDLILVPLGVWLVLKLIPKEVIEDCREHAMRLMATGKPKNWIMGGLFIIIWILLGFWIAQYSYQLFLR